MDQLKIDLDDLRVVVYVILFITLGSFLLVAGAVDAVKRHLEQEVQRIKQHIGLKDEPRETESEN